LIRIGKSLIALLKMERRLRRLGVYLRRLIRANKK
jgi:hypothetical protein